MPTVPSAKVTVGEIGTASGVAIASPSVLAAADGLYPSGVLLPVAVSTGAALSTVQVAVREVVELLPHASTAVHVLV